MSYHAFLSNNWHWVPVVFFKYISSSALVCLKNQRKSFLQGLIIPHHEEWCIHQGLRNSAHRAENIWINDRGCHVHLARCEGDQHPHCSLWVSNTEAQTKTDNSLAQEAAASLVLLLRHGSTYAKQPSISASCNRTEWTLLARTRSYTAVSLAQITQWMIQAVSSSFNLSPQQEQQQFCKI